MRDELNTLISKFRAAQDLAVDTLENLFKWPRPASALAWVMFCLEHKIHDIESVCGVGVYAHGFGIRLEIDDLTIDFDWGPNGEPDGFDAWRLYNFTLHNEPTIICTYNDVSQWIEESYLAGELSKLNHLYFDPRHRAFAT